MAGTRKKRGAGWLESASAVCGARHALACGWENPDSNDSMYWERTVSRKAKV